MTAQAGIGNRGGGGAHADGSRDADFDLLIEDAIGTILVAGERADQVFGPFAELNSLVRAVTYHEGKLLALGVARLASENPALTLMPAETALPIVPAAVEMLKRNGWDALKGLRLRSEVHYRTTYTPDLFIVDHAKHSALILDVKRSLATYQERRLVALRERMMAAALIAADWLHIEGRVAGVTSVEIAIIDGSSERRDRRSGIFALDEIGELIGVPDAGEALLELRANFAQRVQEEIRAACLRAIGDVDIRGGFGADDVDGIDDVALDNAITSGEGSEHAVAGLVDEGARRALEDDVETVLTGKRSGARAGRGRGIDVRSDQRPILVGFARGEVP
ncbi:MULTISPECIES: hypothetical protein [unclassified Aminobacter]|uniref:hypothetical protein n=1 Tax=unclassified Aminobacter TaxID=2644704 RepID=UPI0004645853|nr:MULTISPECIES: hypothetical protein [unclassified Aminobacter]